MVKPEHPLGFRRSRVKNATLSKMHSSSSSQSHSSKITTAARNNMGSHANMSLILRTHVIRVGQDHCTTANGMR